jgi:hypothetical protein
MRDAMTFAVKYMNEKKERSNGGGEV